MAPLLHLQRGISMSSSRALWWRLVVAVSVVPRLAMGGAAARPPAPKAATAPEDREIPPDRGHIYMLEKDFTVCLKRLRSPSTPLDKRVEAVGAFALTKDHRVVPLFDKLARDEAQPIELRVAVLWALGEIGDLRALPALQNALYQMFLGNAAWAYKPGIHVELDGQARKISLQEMVTAQIARLAEARVGKLAGKDGFVEFLTAPLFSGVTEADDSKADKRRAALITLAAVGDRDGRAVKALCDVLRADDKYYPWDFKIIAARALGELTKHRREAFGHLAAKDKLLDDVAKAFIEGAAVTDVPEVREIVGRSLRQMGWADRAGRQLAIVLESPALPKASRFRVIEALTFIRSKQAADALILQLAHPDPNVRWRAAVALGATGHNDPKTAVRFLAKLTTRPPEDDPKVRMKACAGLGHLEDPRAIPPLAVAMEDPDWRVRAQAAVALGKLGNRAAIPALAARGLEDPSPHVRAMSIVALGTLGREEGLEHVAAMVADPKTRDKSAAVRLVAVRVLDQFLNPWATRALIAALADDDPKARDAATKAMASRLARRPKTTLPMLIDIIAGPPGPGRGAALQCVVADYRSPKTLNNPKRKAFYDNLLGGADSPLTAALLRALEDVQGDGKSRALAASFLTDLAWRRQPKNKDILARVAALTRDPEAGVRAAARRAKNVRNNLR